MPKVVPQYKEEAKERIIQAALEIYSEKGPNQVTMDDVAKKLGVSKGALYLYFKSKDEILNEVIKATEQSVRKFLLSLLETNDLSKRLDDVFNNDMNEPNRQRRSLIFDFIAEGARNPETHKAVSEAYQQNLNALTDFLANKDKQKTEKSRYQAVSLLALYLGIRASSILGVQSDDLRQAWQQSTKAILADRGNK
jgi:AcrR family transcriptional regulator